MKRLLLTIAMCLVSMPAEAAMKTEEIVYKIGEAEFRSLNPASTGGDNGSGTFSPLAEWQLTEALRTQSYSPWLPKGGIFIRMG